MINIYYSMLLTNYGQVWALATDRGLFSILLKDLQEDELEKVIQKEDDEIFEVQRNDKKLKHVTNQLKGYFEGKPQPFDFEFDLDGTTPFQRSVWETTMTIPYGETRTYGWIAREIDRPKAVRASGNALSANPLPIIIPCHRVVSLTGLGGYTAGVQWKKNLLQLEGYEVQE